MEDIYIDLGVTSREEALELVQIGDPITYEDNLSLNDHILTARALDNRIGGYIVAQVLYMLENISDVAGKCSSG